MPLKDLTWLANRTGRKLEGEPTLFWERVMVVLNNRLGAILQVRAEVERREDRVRRKKVVRRG